MRRANAENLKGLLEAVYGASLLVSMVYGLITNKPAPAFTAIVLASASGARHVTTHCIEKPLKARNQRLEGEISELLEQVEKLKEALRVNYGWFEKFQKLEQSTKTQDQQRLEQLNKVRNEYGLAAVRVRELESALKQELATNEDWALSYKELQAELKVYKQPFEEEIKRLKEAGKAYQKRYEECVADYNSAVDRNSELSAKIHYLELQIQALLAPKKLADELDTAKMANSLSDWFHKANPAIVVDAESASVSGQDWVLLFKLRNRKDAARIRELATAIKIDYSLPVAPTIKIEDDRLKITVHRGEVHNESKYLKIDPQWLKDCLVFPKAGKLEPHHVRISGSTESGKSTFTSNAIGVLIMSIPFIQVELADPLLKGRSEWNTLKPKYNGQDETVAGFIQFYNDYKACDEGKAEPGHPRVFLMDEFDKVMKAHPDLVPLVLEIWKSGRHYGFYLWVIGQSAMVGKFGLNLEDIDNLVGIYIGKSIERGFSDSAEDPNYTARLREEWHTARARGIEYVCLVRPHTTNRRPFLAKMPAPGTFATGSEALKIAENQKEEERLDYKALEFDVDAVQRLENLFNQPVAEPDSKPVQNNSSEDSVKVRAIALYREGKRVHEIIKAIWGLNPSRSAEYKARKAEIEAIIKGLGNQ